MRNQEIEAASSTKSYAFGKNWQSYLANHLTEDRLEIAKQSLLAFADENPIQGKTFLDIGCGSGLFSLAAYRLGASRVVSFDPDADSVSCCESLREREGNPPFWSVSRGSILDENFLAALGQFDWVYAWGVLHHTGAMLGGPPECGTIGHSRRANLYRDLQ